MANIAPPVASFSREFIAGRRSYRGAFLSQDTCNMLLIAGNMLLAGNKQRVEGNMLPGVNAAQCGQKLFLW